MRRSVHIAAAIALASALWLVAIAPPARAGQVCSGNANTAPDGRIRVNNGSWSGESSYPVTVATKKLAKGKTATFDLQWRNISGQTRASTIRLHSVVGGSGAYSVKYLYDGRQISAANLKLGVVAFQWTNGTLSDTLRVVITKKTAQKVNILVRIQGSYTGAPACDGLFPRVRAA